MAPSPSPTKTKGAKQPKMPKAGSNNEQEKGLSPLLAFLAILIAFSMGRSLQTGFYLEQEASSVEIALEDMLASKFHASAGPKKPKNVNLQRIQHILNINQTEWEPFAKMKTVNGSVFLNISSAEGIDATKNLPRIQEYAKTLPNSPGRTSQERSLKDERDSESNSDGQKKKHKPLNIMFFYADDWTMNVLGALNKDVMTPNIDAMAERGMLFTRNCVTTSVCWISRSTMVTGNYASVHRHLQVAGEQLFNNTVPWLETLFPLLKSNGYYTGLIGKWHAPSPKEFTENAFDFKRGYFGKHWYPRGNRMAHVTDLNGEHALQYLKGRPKDKNFALCLAFYATHALDNDIPPFQPMNESMKLYQNVTIDPPKTATEEHWKKMPWFFTEKNVGRSRRRHRFDPPSFQAQIKNLYRMATEVDAVIGAIIDELKKQGVYEETMIIFSTDNGVFRGEHGLAEKWYPFEESIKVPLVIQDPRMHKDFVGTRNDEFTLSVDLAPTILSAAGIPVPKRMQGRDIAELYLDHEHAMSTWRQDFFYEWVQGNPIDADGHPPYYQIPAVFGLIRKDYKYFYWPQVNYEQLFHIEKDPYEEYDIWNSTAQTTKEVLQLMKARYQFLKTWAQSGNPV